MKELLQHISKGENEFIEFKTSFNKEVIETLFELIAKAFKEIGLVERYGSRIKRILNICFDYGVIVPTFKVIHQGLKVVVFKEKLDNVGNELRGLQKTIIKWISNNNKITITKLASKTNRTTRTIERNIEKLKERNLIKRIGSRKEGYWKIIK